MADLRIGAFLLIGWVVAATSLAAEPRDFAATYRMKATVEGLSDALAPRQQAARIAADLGLPPVRHDLPAPAPIPDFAAKPGAVVELVDLRLILTQIAVQTGARDHQTLIRAQGERDHKIILLRGGFTTLPQFVALSRGTPAAEYVTETDDGVVLTRPLAIWSDAGLQLGATELLVMDRPAGSFLTNFGWLDLQGGRVSGTEPANGAAPEFRPFILTAGVGRLTLREATLQHLGFGDTAVFGGLSVVNSGLKLPLFPSRISGSTLIDVGTLSLLGTEGPVVADNHLSHSQGTAILVSRSRKAVIARNTLVDPRGAQAIRITSESQDVAIVENYVSEGASTGVLIDQDSTDILVGQNILLGQTSTGVSVSDAFCVHLRANLIAKNGGAGVSIRGSDAVTLSENAILFNKGAGVLIRDQAAQAVARLSGNVLLGNREGLRGATPGLLALDGNDLQGQLPRIFAGDLAPLTVDWLRNGQTDMPLPRPLPSPAPCANRVQG
ncbi:right-handed parallel beta-helix repeat-containing protein [Frigidibacter sp.]|uniref:right-handed parallel beta-helix repeat-containing protein n=1 Tax=Frigidibacter sp. TaxID=2586418 RepID=UPI0027359D54|nr:right-handed parallel beta-helix repeat-containing protein [Frigidibacter sp.]MDP3340491.1 right-handed parallel beta-helix repeat-containing protein [Frigidibacter sp.]